MRKLILVATALAFVSSTALAQDKVGGTAAPTAQNGDGMISLPFATVLEAAQDQSLFTRFVKGLAAHCSHRFRCVAFFNRGISICRPHGLVGCEVAAIMAFPSGPIFREEENDPRFCFIVCGADGAGGRRPCRRYGISDPRIRLPRRCPRPDRAKPSGTNSSGDQILESDALIGFSHRHSMPETCVSQSIGKNLRRVQT